MSFRHHHYFVKLYAARFEEDVFVIDFGRAGGLKELTSLRYAQLKQSDDRRAILFPSSHLFWTRVGVLRTRSEPWARIVLRSFAPAGAASASAAPNFHQIWNADNPQQNNTTDDTK